MSAKELPIKSNPRKMSGQVCIADTRMPVSTLLLYLARGGSVQSFTEEYSCDQQEVVAALAFVGMEVIDLPEVVAALRAYQPEPVRQPERVHEPDRGANLA